MSREEKNMTVINWCERVSSGHAMRQEFSNYYGEGVKIEFHLV